MDDLLSEFVAETLEGLESLDNELVRFEQAPDAPQVLDGIFRVVHTIKGASGFLGLSRMQAVAHSAENVLGAFRDREVAVTPAAVTSVLESVDVIRRIIDGLAATGEEPAGDDRELIAKLDRVLETGAAPAAPAAAPAARERPLIERLGGDATVDAAVEMALADLRSGWAAEALSTIDPDRLQCELSAGFSAIARREAPGADVSRALAGCGSASQAVGEAVVVAVAEALQALDAEPPAVETLKALASETDQAAPAAGNDDKATPPAVAAAPPAPPATTSDEPSVSGEVAAPKTIRVSVDALEHLMTVVSELVLIRNQLLQALRLDPESTFAAPLHRLNQVTSELQEGVMTTRMQPISGAWSKLPRVVRDLANDLGKQVELVMQGQETELDRQVLELVKDPLTHMIRNAVDHGIEAPAQRVASGKSEVGRITLQARHEGGAILIEVSDDGRGLSAAKLRSRAVSSGLLSAAQAEAMSDGDVQQLIFAPGFSTAAQVTSVSGRGVGMDVVRTNIEKIGGAIELSSVEGQGTQFTIRIPLTLTIVSALIVECCGERFAMPQAGVVELVSASGSSGRSIEYIAGAAVLRLRDRLLPLVSLQALLGLVPEGEPSQETCIVVVKLGTATFGIVVDRVFDTEEIVVKPVASVLRHIRAYSGATILGDGSVVLILDLKGVATEAIGQNPGAAFEDRAEAEAVSEDKSSLLLFKADGEALRAAPLASVSRIEELQADQLERVDGRSVVQYRGSLMPILGCDGRPAATWSGDPRPLLVFAGEDRTVGLLVDEIVDIVESSLKVDLGANGKGVLGSLVIGGTAAELIDVDHYRRCAGGERTASAPARRADPQRRVLLIDGSPFTQLLVSPMLSRAGYDVVVAKDAAAASRLYQDGEVFRLILADTSVPETALELAQALGKATNWHSTPLLSLATQGRGAGDGVNNDGRTLLSALTASLEDLKGAA